MIVSKPESSDWVFGSTSLPSYATSEKTEGEWKAYLPINELQRKFSFESQGCVSYSTLNAAETIIKYKYNKEENFSDRFLAKLSDTQRNGNSPNKVAETLRKAGVVHESEYEWEPDINTWDEFYAPVPPKLFELAREFLSNYTFKHYYVQGTKEAILDALQFSPVAISVSAWVRDNGIYKQFGADNHFTLCYGFNKQKDAYKVFDSYDDTFKLYDANAKIAVAKGFYVAKRKERKPWYCLWGIPYEKCR